MQESKQAHTIPKQVTKYTNFELHNKRNTEEKEED